jgi:hypothetical protein
MDAKEQASKQARKRFAVFQSSFQHCFHLQCYLSTPGGWRVALRDGQN